jgi:hypothetical protein
MQGHSWAHWLATAQQFHLQAPPPLATDEMRNKMTAVTTTNYIIFPRQLKSKNAFQQLECEATDFIGLCSLPHHHLGISLEENKEISVLAKKQKTVGWKLGT